MNESNDPRPYDLLIVGAGTAGLPAAIEAARAGGRVAVVEKSSEIGGTLHVSGGHLSAGGTQRQRERGIEDSPEAHAADIERISNGTARMDLVERAVGLAPGTIDWLGDHGFEFAEDCPRLVYGHEPYSVARTYYGTDEARSILAVLRPLFEQAVASGRVDLLLNCRARRLSVDGGRVVGCVADGPDGELSIVAQATLLTTGGVAGAPELFEELHRQPLVSAAQPTSTGDGLRMVQGLGGQAVGGEMYLPTFGGLRSPDDPQRTVWKERPLLVATEREPVEIYVTRRGHRFVAEDEPSIHKKEEAQLANDAMTFFVVLDERGLEAAENLIVGWSADQVRAISNHRPGFWSAATLEELAERAGIEPVGLRDTVVSFNRAVETGHDEVFGRSVLSAPIAEPPFYAIQNHGITLISFAGIDVDDQLRVRRADGETIPGLYAAGEAIGAAATCGRSFCGGMLLTPSLSFGRWLGRTLVEASKKERDDGVA